MTKNKRLVIIIIAVVAAAAAVAVCTFLVNRLAGNLTEKSVRELLERIHTRSSRTRTESRGSHAPGARCF